MSTWLPRTFVVKHNDRYYCENPRNSKLNLQAWQYCKQLKSHTITIDGKDIELSEESFNNLKEQLCGE